MPDSRIDLVYFVCDTLMSYGHWGALSCLLQDVDRQAPTDELLSWATATLPGSGLLPGRSWMIAELRSRGVNVEGL
ncbi:MAG: hypothetical protein U0990_09640 [Candidatus Nanopelagicales bacterium]|nr:hypothetical protein [Candidatus Nanopelagicales bacterium]